VHNIKTLIFSSQYATSGEFSQQYYMPKGRLYMNLCLFIQPILCLFVRLCFLHHSFTSVAFVAISLAMRGPRIFCYGVCFSAKKKTVFTVVLRTKFTPFSDGEHCVIIITQCVLIGQYSVGYSPSPYIL